MAKNSLNKAPLKLAASLLRRWIPPRRPDSHKGTYGHVLIVAGSRGMSGAASLCAAGALRGGAGLVTVGVPASQQPILARRIHPEAMTLALPETPRGTLAAAAAADLLAFIARRRVTTLAIGPGLSGDPPTADCVRRLLARLDRDPGTVKALVLDADGFLALRPQAKSGDFLKKIHLPLIVTPHPGEFAKFRGLSAARVQSDRIAFAREFARLYSIVCVLKGHATVVTDGREAYVNGTGNPGMAKGGAGDVLTGLAAALALQVPIGLLEAAAAAVYIHGLAGDLAAQEKSEIGLVAGDIAEKIPQAFRRALGR